MEKENLKLKELKKSAKRKLLSNEYGKYDYVEKLLGRDYILSNPPRLIRLYICEQLDIKKEELKTATFFSWLRSYKKRQAKLKKNSSSLSNQKFSENDINDSFNFIPTDPLTLIKKESDINSIIKIANRP